jgi:hypothetical protein
LATQGLTDIFVEEGEEKEEEMVLRAIELE